MFPWPTYEASALVGGPRGGGVARQCDQLLQAPWRSTLANLGTAMGTGFGTVPATPRPTTGGGRGRQRLHCQVPDAGGLETSVPQRVRHGSAHLDFVKTRQSGESPLVRYGTNHFTVTLTVLDPFCEPKEKLWANPFRQRGRRGVVPKPTGFPRVTFLDWVFDSG